MMHVLNVDTKELQDLTDSVQRWVNDLDDKKSDYGDLDDDEQSQLDRLRDLLEKLCGV